MVEHPFPWPRAMIQRFRELKCRLSTKAQQERLVIVEHLPWGKHCLPQPRARFLELWLLDVYKSTVRMGLPCWSNFTQETTSSLAKVKDSESFRCWLSTKSQQEWLPPWSTFTGENSPRATCREFWPLDVCQSSLRMGLPWWNTFTGETPSSLAKGKDSESFRCWPSTKAQQEWLPGWSTFAGENTVFPGRGLDS